MAMLSGSYIPDERHLQDCQDSPRYSDFKLGVLNRS